MIIVGEPNRGDDSNLRQRLAKAEAEAEALRAQLELHRREHEQHAATLAKRLESLQTEMAVRRRRRDPSESWESGLGELFNRIAGEIIEGGWDWTYRRWVGDPDGDTTKTSGSSGDGNISVIPGTGGACTETVLVFLKSRDWPHGFHPRHHGQEMDTLRIHLVECQKVRRVLIISDTIHMPSFDDEYLRWIRAWSARGVAFAHALVAPDRRTLLPIPLGI
jgi:hypothetical protein